MARGCLLHGKAGQQSPARGTTNMLIFSWSHQCFANRATSRDKTIPVRPALLLVFGEASPFPLPLQRHVRSPGCERLIPSPAVTPVEPTLPTEITPCRSRPSAHPQLRDLFFISSCSPLSPSMRCKGLAADPVAPFAFLQRIISSGCCVSGDRGLSRSHWMPSWRRHEKQICAV